LNPPAAAIVLRAGTPADLQCVAALMAAAFDPRFGEAWTPAQCMGVLSLPGIWLTLAEADGDACGFAMVRSAADEAELLLLAVDPRARRRGVGSTLLAATIAQSAARNVRRLHLEVRAGNDAVHLYQKLGFQKVGVRRAYYRGADGHVFDAHSFSLDVPVT
jgi:[ribosomal protein S18]-alanine N-acetyltransferase